MSRRAIEVEFADMRGEDLGVPLLVEFGGDEILQGPADQCSLGLPEDQTLAHHFINVKQPHLATQLAMVALFRLL